MPPSDVATPDAPPPAHPYRGLPARAFWRGAVGERAPGDFQDLYRRRFAIGAEDRIATAGSCFAQHIARRLRAAGYAVLDREPAPRGLDAATAARFGYGVYSARYGNIYTARQLLRLVEECQGRLVPSDIAWTRDGRWYDALRPAVEPDGLDSAEEVLALRQDHLRHLRLMLREATVLIFTLGLTEAWMEADSGTVYPTAPGTIAGHYDPARHVFHNFSYEEVLADLLAVRKVLRRGNPAMRFILTVSPVPLAATASGGHVLAATMQSKSILRAVAGAMADRHEDVDYFPSYEIIASPAAEGRYYEADRRNVSAAGVDAVMREFFAQHPPLTPPPPLPRKASAEAVACEEAMLEAFGP